MSSTSKPILFSYWRSSCAWRVRLVLNLKEISYDIETIDIFKDKGEQFSEEYRAVNPMQQVPALRIDGLTLIESLAIIQHLEDTRPEPPILPKDVAKRATVRAISEIIVSGIQPMQNSSVLNRVGDEKEQEEWAQFYIMRGFRAIEEILSKSSGKYCVGDDITLADCCLIPQVFNARRFKVDLGPYPTIVRIDRQLESHPAFRIAHAYNQPDCPTDKL